MKLLTGFFHGREINARTMSGSGLVGLGETLKGVLGADRIEVVVRGRLLEEVAEIDSHAFDEHGDSS